VDLIDCVDQLKIAPVPLKIVLTDNTLDVPAYYRRGVQFEAIRASEKSSGSNAAQEYVPN
jgi:hypothetical protein